MGSATLFFPHLDSFRGRIIGSTVQQMRTPPREVAGSTEKYKNRSVEGVLFKSTADAADDVLILSRSTSAKDLPEHVLLSPAGLPKKKEVADVARWIRPKPLAAPTVAECRDICETVRESWSGAFTFVAEREEAGVITMGLRPPQIGALHAILAHWSITNVPATVVMPTGTGKTETMLALMIAERLKRVLVIVPSDALREQISGKFLTLGVLKAAGVVGPSAQLPIVGILERKPATPEEVEEFFTRCNVVVTTAAIAGSCGHDILQRIASLCTHLFVDEAHHVRAPSWLTIRDAFVGKPVLQFTATPYRGDGQLVDGRVVYNYPLKKAQAEGYFKQITFHAVEEFNDALSDEEIARAAIKQLDADRAAGFDHMVMARCSKIERAEEVFAVYKKLAPQYAPVLAHSELGSQDRAAVVQALRNRKSRIVVCVNMFGEGFDLPALKIAAMHDIHKGLAITLQFTGRFTRSQTNVGSATMIANTAEIEVKEALQALYGEDPDWNLILRELSEEATGEQVLRSEFVQGFNQVPESIPIQNVFPKMSTIVYRTTCSSWKPEAVAKLVDNLVDVPAIHAKERVLMLVTREHDPVPWGDIRGITDTTHDLYLLHWDEKTQLLYIHSSKKDSAHDTLARAACGESVAPIKGERVYQVLYGINRLILMNLGLGHTLTRAVRFTMHVGADIREGLSEAHAQNKIKTNLFGYGYEAGNRTTIGCSAKGKIWSYRIAPDIGEWVKWCHHIGEKLQNPKINVAEILKGALIPQVVTSRPHAVPLTIDWSDELLGRSEEAVKIEYAGVTVPLYEVTLEVASFDDSGPLRFRLRCDGWPAGMVEYAILFASGRVEYRPVGNSTEPQVSFGRRTRPLSTYLHDEPPFVRFHDGSFLWYDQLYPADTGTREAFNRTRIEAWAWAGVDKSKESQKREKRLDSIQRHVIEHLLALAGDDAFDVIFDDDESGEAADIIAIRVSDDRFIVHLYHCKYSKSGEAGARVKDMYEVCGQAQRSVYWKGQPGGLLNHMAHREGKRLATSTVSRFERGSLKTLKMMKRMLRTLKPEFTIAIVQPGLSRAGAETAQLELLAVTELYLKTTYGTAMRVIASD